MDLNISVSATEVEVFTKSITKSHCSPCKVHDVESPPAGLATEWEVSTRYAVAFCLAGHPVFPHWEALGSKSVEELPNSIPEDF